MVDYKTIVRHIDSVLRSAKRPDELRDLEHYLQGLPEDRKRELRAAINSGEWRGPDAAVTNVLLDNPRPDYASLMEQCRAYRTMPNERAGPYKDTMVMSDQRYRQQVIGFVNGNYTPQGKTDTQRLRMAFSNDYNAIVRALEERGYNEQDARRLVAQASKKLDKLELVIHKQRAG
jgi:hypothetical protein